MIPEDVFQKEFEISVCLTTEQFSTLPQSSLNELWTREDGSVSGSCLPLCMNKCINLHLQMTQLPVLTDSGFRIMPIFNAVLSVGLQITVSNTDFQSWRLHTEISPDLLMASCNVDDEILNPWSFYTEELKLFHNL